LGKGDLMKKIYFIWLVVFSLADIFAVNYQD